MIVFLDELSEFPDYYASSEGFIVNTKNEPYEHIRGEDGYYRVFCKVPRTNTEGDIQGEKKEILVHEEIAKNFVKFDGDREGLKSLIVYHKNWDRSDNRPENLEWREKEDPTERQNRIKFDKDYLYKFCDKYHIQLKYDYLNEKVTRETQIYAKCTRCDKIMIKKFRELTKNKNFGCVECSKIIRLEKVKNTNIEKYGAEHHMQTDEFKQKFKETCVEKFGCDHPMQNKTIKQRVIETNIERFGSSHHMQNDEIKQKIKKTNLTRYGCENPSQNKAIRQKAKNTCFEKYGHENPLQSKEIKQKIKVTNLEKFGYEHPMQNDEIKQKAKNTCFEKYGSENPMQNNKVKQKAERTCIKKYGNKNPMQNDRVKEKFKETSVKRYGYDNPMKNNGVKDKFKNSNLEKFGCEHPMQNEEIKQKFNETCLKSFGCEHPMQNSGIADKASKSAFASKDFVYPSGKIEKIQGYEHFALDELLNSGLTEDDIITQRSKVPEIWYVDQAGKKHRYYVDIYVPSQNRCIEVKSTWTFKKKEDIVTMKYQATKDAGYCCEIWVYNQKGLKINCI